MHLRHAVTHDFPACWFGVGRSTVTLAIGEVQPLLAGRGLTISPDPWWRSSRMSATGVRVLRPADAVVTPPHRK
ncbi:transposase family protein [Streptomyces sp. NPDC007164]|uniref:transposase family protein n=1 Tax=Streptomyces sp. NPDC007164 TaxID=3156918 RepID=UPI0033E8AEA6